MSKPKESSIQSSFTHVSSILTSAAHHYKTTPTVLASAPARAEQHCKYERGRRFTRQGRARERGRVGGRREGGGGKGERNAIFSALTACT